MIRIAKRSIRHPRAALALWIAFAIGFGLLGSQLESRFSPSITVAEGTQSAAAQKFEQQYFGESQLTPIMLTGPAAQLDKQGPTLVAHLRARPDTTVLAPWDQTPGSEVLRPKPTQAVIVASVAQSEKYMISTGLPDINQAVDNLVASPVKAHVTGQASINKAIRDESLSQTRIATAVAIPLVLLVLLVVLRAPVAALLVTGFAASMLPVGYGLTAIAASIIPVDAVAAAGAAMVGLALGVGFGMLMVSRFRQKLAEGGDPSAAAHFAAESSGGAGRALLVAATAMVVAMVVASMLSMPEILNSIGIGATLMAVVAAVGVVGVLPAALYETGGRIEAWHFGPDPTTAPRAISTRRAAIPAVVAGVGLVVLLGLSVPVMGLESGPPGPKMLPSDNQARKDYEAVSAVMGPGWLNPFDIVVARGGKPITDRTFLGQIADYENTLAKDKAVDSVLGPGALLTNARELQGVPKGLNTAAATAKASKKDLKKLIDGLRLATNGVAQIRGGLGAAANGAGQLHGGTGQAYGGSGQLASGLSQANAGAQQLKVGSAQAAAGAKELAGGLSLAQNGVSGGLPAIDKVIAAMSANASHVGGLKSGSTATSSEIAAAAATLAQMTVGKGDPSYDAAVAKLQSAAAANDQLASAITATASESQLNAQMVSVIRSQVVTLEHGIGKLLAGGNQLSNGLQKLSSGNGQLAGGISQLDAGGAKLQAGLAQLNAGAGRLAAGLGAGVGPSGMLLEGMNTITKSVVKARNGIPSTAALEKLKAESPGLFDSGYFVLAALDGAPTASRQAASFVVNVDNGGTAGKIQVFPKADASDPATIALYDRLQASATQFAASAHATTAVGGVAANLVDYKAIGLDKLPIVIAALAALTFLLLAILTRSLLVPAVSVVLNLLTVTAAFGVLTLLFGGDSPVLGGPGWVDPVTMIAVTTVVLALAADYEVFGVARLRRVTGTGLAMFAVVLAFVPATLTLISQFAIGMAVALAADALVARPVISRLQARRPPEKQGMQMEMPHFQSEEAELERVHMTHFHLPRRH